MWAWVLDADNLRVLSSIGGAVAFLWTAGWAVYVRHQDLKIKAAEAATATPAREREVNQKRKPTRKRSMASILGFAIASWAVGLAIVVATLVVWKEFLAEKPPVVSFVCRAENGSECLPESEKVDCGDAAPAIARATSDCKRSDVKQVEARDGGRCGHNTWKITCTPKTHFW